MDRLKLLLGPAPQRPAPLDTPLPVAPGVPLWGAARPRPTTRAA